LAPAIDPVGFNTVVFTGVVVGPMLCSWTATNFAQHIPPCHNMFLLSSLSSLGGIGAAVCFVLHFITTELGLKVPFYFLDLLCVIFFYFLWQRVKYKVAGTFAHNYPRKSNLINGQTSASELDKKKADKESYVHTVVFNTLMPISLLVVYMLILIPSFASASPPVQFLLRCVGHTWIKGQQDMRQRDAIANGKFQSTVKAASLNMFVMEAVYSLLGRFLVSSSANSSTGWYFATILTTSYMEFFSRVNAEAIKCFFRVCIHKTGPLTGRELQNYTDCRGRFPGPG